MVALTKLMIAQWAITDPKQESLVTNALQENTLTRQQLHRASCALLVSLSPLCPGRLTFLALGALRASFLEQGIDVHIVPKVATPLKHL